MKLKSLNKYICFLISFFFIQPLFAEEEIDIWKKEIKKNSQSVEQENNISTNSINSNILKLPELNENIKIEGETLEGSKDIKIFGIYDPAENNFDLNMWSLTDAEKVRSSFKRINKIELSNTAEQLFENTILSLSYPPSGMSDEEFLLLKINWMILNKKVEIIEKFLKQNDTFPNKKKLIQYLVDNNIAKANIKEGCNKINFLDKSIKDSYLEKFKIYCLVYDKKNNEAQVQRGAYLTKAGDCIACHTQVGGAAFAGGLALVTPFGTFYTPNITPDKQNGIGSWTDAQFLKAMRHGIRPDGLPYYPAFPYVYYNKASDEDILAIKAYLERVPISKQENTPITSASKAKKQTINSFDLNLIENFIVLHLITNFVEESKK